ncbi:hypothetical protein AQUCO_01400853v1 [Aquilegia coerulea]|uniref:TBCC domain-containing protein 1 n=1 Tax=Aquilegia coerulea TaxID=218851 RepID=A0A2G5DYF3_AQUCA|nr:hypothetical protein AQUCO_01400853v1 [Aquilegia coerulea]
MEEEGEIETSKVVLKDQQIFLRARREPFEYGLLPISKIIFSDGITTLLSLKQILISRSNSLERIDSQSISEILQLSIEYSDLIIDTIASVLPFDSSDPIVNANPKEISSFGVNVYDLLLFLYIQSYKRLVFRSHKDSASVADVWPSTSAFDGYLSALSPLQLVRSNSRKFMPSQVDEEAHQLSYLQKHLDNLLSLLATSREDEDEESMVLTSERLDHLGFLIQFGEKGSDRIPLSQASPFFANSDPEMPAVDVSAVQVHDWIYQNITLALEQTAERGHLKENGPSNGSDQDVSMADVCISSDKGLSAARSLSFVEGISKTSVAKKASDIGSSVKVLNCHDSVIYILAPLRYATLYGCSDATIVLGAVGKVLRVEHCERVQVLTAAKRICIANCRECTFFLGVNQRPLILGDNHKMQVAPYNTFYSQLEEHMAQVGVDATTNRWNESLVLGTVDPHDALSHPAGVSDTQAESATCLDPDQFTNFMIPNWFGEESAQSTKHNPFPLPEIYMASQQKNHQSLGEIKQALRDLPLDENKKRELSSALHVYFKEWLYASGNIRQLYCLQGD